MSSTTDALSDRPVASFVALTFLLSWGVWIPVSQVTTDPTVQFLALLPGGFGPAVAAAVVVAGSGGSLRAWVRDMARWRVAPRWYLAALGLPLLFTAAESLAYAAFVGPLDPSVLPGRLALWVGSFVTALVVTGGNEELGWRGFMQPRLQRAYSAVTAAVVVGVVWTLWHLPLHLFLTGVSSGLTEPTAVLSRVATVPVAVLLAWLYNGSGGSVVVAMLFHAGWNSSQGLVPAPLGAGGDAVATSTAVLLWGARVVALLAVVACLLVVHGGESLAPADRHTQRAVGGPAGGR